jgi:transcriptional regulator with XRE-family HTH domain
VRARTATLGTRLGQRIRELRGALSLTQEELAGRAGISISFLSMIERAERMPYVETLAVLAARQAADMLPELLKVLVDLLDCADQEARAEVGRLLRVYGPRMMEELERRNLRH